MLRPVTLNWLDVSDSRQEETASNCILNLHFSYDFTK